MIVCPACGEESGDRAKFCQACGAPLPKAEQAPREVRKTVTISFSDVAGFTPLGERLDPESLRRVMGRYFDAVRAVVERHGGVVEKFIGDAVMAVFGIPAVHEDDALRAVRAAAEIRDALKELNKELERDFEVSLVIRTGINTGEVVAGGGEASRVEALVVGDAVNVAARLEQAAAPGDILLGDPTYRLVRDAVEVEAIDALPLKGKSAPVPAWRLVSVTPDVLGHERRLDSPMIGREHEAYLLAQAFERSVRERSTHLFTLLGSAGVGKSRLASEILGAISGRARILSGRCLPYGQGITFWPVIQIIKEAAGIVDADSPDEARRRIAATLDAEPQAEQIAEYLSRLAGFSETSIDRDAVFTAVRRFLEGLARAQPLAVVFDDIHWGEPAFLDLVEAIADWSRDAPLMLLCLGRPELLDVRPGWGGGKMNASSILLEPLGEAECDRLIENLLGRVEIDPQARARIAHAAEGNPLFVEEMLEMLIDEGALVRDGDRWSAVGDLSAMSVPPTIHALIAARLDKLTLNERLVIERASVVGKEFWRRAVADLCPDALGPDVGVHLGTLVRKELIRPERSSLAGDDAFRFRHILIRDAAYAAMPKEMRGQLHERFGEWLRGFAGERLAEYEEIVGYHLEQAHRYAAELGSSRDDIALSAATHLAAAGRRAQGRADLTAAANLLGRALALLGPHDPERVGLLVDLAMNHLDLTEYERSASLIEEAESLARATGDRRAQAMVALVRHMLRVDVDPTLSGEAILRDALPIATELEARGDDRGAGLAWTMISQAYWLQARAEPAMDAAWRAASFAERGGHTRDHIRALNMITGGLAHGPTPVSEVPAVLAELSRRSGGHPSVEVSCLYTRCYVLLMEGLAEEARRAIREMDALADQTLVGAVSIGMGAEATAALELGLGNYAAVVEALSPVVQEYERRGHTGFLCTTYAYMSLALAFLGRREEAEHAARRAEETAAPDDLSGQIPWRLARARLLADRGETMAAEALEREALALADTTDFPALRASGREALADLLARTGDHEQAGALVRQARAIYEAKGDRLNADRLAASLERQSSPHNGGPDG